MSDKEFDLQKYMTKGVENIVKGALKATLSDPKESLFMVKYAAASKEASKRRAKLKEEAFSILTRMVVQSLVHFHHIQISM